MYFKETPEDNYSKDLSISPEIRGYLSETAKWATFISVMGFISLGFMILTSIGVGFYIMTRIPKLEQVYISYSLYYMFPLTYFVFALVMLIPVLYLYKFASKMKLALKNNDNLVLAKSFKNLKYSYKFYGILMISLFVFYVLTLFVMPARGLVGFP